MEGLLLERGGPSCFWAAGPARQWSRICMGGSGPHGGSSPPPALRRTWT